MDFTTLSPLTVLSDSVTVIEIDQAKVLRVMHDKATAAIALHGGHVLSFKPQGQDELIWLSEQAIFDNKAAIRGGIPICWPWFGRIASPAHGFARNSQWTLIEHSENANGVMVELGLQSSPETLAIWPHHFEVRLFIEISDELKLTLDIKNTDNTPWPFSAALHTYLAVGDILQTQTTAMGLSYLDSLQAGKPCQGNEILQLAAGIDRIYTQPEAQIVVKDAYKQRNLYVENQGHNSAVLWNPWAEGAQAMTDMQDTGYKHFLCVESALHAASIEQGKVLQPNQSHQLSTRISVK